MIFAHQSILFEEVVRFRDVKLGLTRFIQLGQVFFFQLAFHPNEVIIWRVMVGWINRQWLITLLQRVLEGHKSGKTLSFSATRATLGPLLWTQVWLVPFLRSTCHQQLFKLSGFRQLWLRQVTVLLKSYLLEIWRLNCLWNALKHLLDILEAWARRLFQWAIEVCLKRGWYTTTNIGWHWY